MGEKEAWATECHVYDSGVVGPTVLVTAGVHGNEPAGVKAAEAIATWTVARGKLVVLPRAAAAAVAADQRQLPCPDGSDGIDLNRCFPEAAEDLPRGQPALALWDLTMRLQPEWLIDLHEGFDFHGRNPESVGNTVIAARGVRTEKLAAELVLAVNTAIREDDEKFQLLRQPAKGSLARAAALRLGSAALILETTKKRRSVASRAAQHTLMVRLALERLEMEPREPPP